MPYRSSELRPPTAPRRSRLRWACGLAALPLVLAPFLVRSAPEARRAAPPEVLVPISCEHPALVAVGEGERRDVLCGPARVTLTPDGATAAAERFERDIVSATPVRDGWIFVTVDGTITRSATFLGPLHLLGRVPCFDADATVARGSAGRAALLDTVGAVWTVDDASTVVRWTFPVRARGAAFRDAAHGAVVLDDGSVLATSDHGGSWPRVDLDGEVAWRVTLTDRGLVSETTGGAMRLTDDGGAEPDGRRPSQWADARRQVLQRREALWRATLRLREVFRVGRPFDECRAAPGTLRERDAPRSLLFEQGSPYRCEVTGPRDEGIDSRRRPLSGAAPEDHVRASIVSGAGLVDAAAWFGPGARRHLVVEWSGRDRDGAFSGRAGPLVVGSTAPPPIADGLGEGPIVVAAVSRQGLLIDAGHFDPSLLWARAGAPVVSLGRPAGLSLGDLEVAPRRVSAVLPGGAVALVRSKRDGDRTVVAALALDPEGRVVAHRGLVLRASMAVGLGRWGATVGVVAWSHDRVRPGSFTPLDGSAPRALPQLPLVAPTACATARRSDDAGALRAWIDGLGPDFYEGTVGDRGDRPRILAWPTRFELEWNGESVCVRAVTLDDAALPDSAAGDTMTLDARPGGRLVGSINDQGVTRVSCAPGPAPPPPDLSAE